MVEKGDTLLVDFGKIIFTVIDIEEYKEEFCSIREEKRKFDSLENLKSNSLDVEIKTELPAVRSSSNLQERPKR